MTTFSDFINDVKDKCQLDWLTPSQMKVFEDTLIRIDTNRVVNIFGKEGNGKTFLGWILEKQGYGSYFVNLSSLDNMAPKDPADHFLTAIVDNFPSSRENHRILRSRMADLGISKAILISEFAIPDLIPRLELDFDETDRKHFKHVLYHYLRLEISDKHGQGNMHDLIREKVWS